jgi:hypothetical protein
VSTDQAEAEAEAQDTTSLPRPPRPPQDIDDAELKRRFTYYPPTGDKASIHEDIRREFLTFALDVIDLIPAGREKSLFVTCLEEAMFWANAGVARDGH